MIVGNDDRHRSGPASARDPPTDRAQPRSPVEEVVDEVEAVLAIFVAQVKKQLKAEGSSYLAVVNALPGDVTDPARVIWDGGLTTASGDALGTFLGTALSYTGAQVFEAIGLGDEVIDEYFTGTTSRLGGIGLDTIAAEVATRHAAAFPDRPEERAHRTLDVGGEYCFSGCTQAADCQSGLCDAVTVTSAELPGQSFDFQTCSPPPQLCRANQECAGGRICVFTGEDPLAANTPVLSCARPLPGNPIGAACNADAICSTSGNAASGVKGPCSSRYCASVGPSTNSITSARSSTP